MRSFSLATTCRFGPFHRAIPRRRRDLDSLDDHLPPQSLKLLSTRVQDYRKVMHRLEARLDYLEREIEDTRRSYQDASIALDIWESRLHTYGSE